MAALVAWIVGTLIGSANKEVKPTVNDQPATPKSSSRKNNKNANSKQTSSKNRKSKPAKEVNIEKRLELPVKTSDLDSSVAEKYQAVSAQELEKRSLDLEKIQEKPRAIDNKVLIPKIHVAGSLTKENSNKPISTGAFQKIQGKGRRKRSPKPEKVEEVVVDQKSANTATERNKKLDQNQREKIKKETEKTLVNEKETSSLTLKRDKDLQQECIKQGKKEVVDTKKIVGSEVAESKDLNQLQVQSKNILKLHQTKEKGGIKKEEKEVVDTKKIVSSEVAESKELNQLQVQSKQVLELHQTKEKGGIKKEKKIVDTKKIVTSEVAESKNVNQLQEQTKKTKILELHKTKEKGAIKKEEEKVVNTKQILNSEVAESKDLNQLQEQTKNNKILELHQTKEKGGIKKEEEEAVDTKQIVSSEVAESNQLQEQTKKTKILELHQTKEKGGIKKEEEEVVVTKQIVSSEVTGSKDLNQLQEQTKKTKILELHQTKEKVSNLQENICSEQKINLSYQQKEIAVPQSKPLSQEKVVSEKSSADDLPKSSIIQHYKTKSKQFVASNETISTSQQTSKFVSRKIEINIKTSNIVQEQPSSLLEEKSLSSTQTEVQKVLNTEAAIMKTVNQVRVLTLNDNEHQDSTLYRIEKNWTLQFRLGPSLLGRKVSLYCNYPESKDGKLMEFNRNRYFLLPWSTDEGCQNADDTALYNEITVKIAGSFHFYFVYENATESGPQGSGFFLVDPVLKYGKNEELPLNCIQCQTVLSKCLGPLSTWESKLRVAKESGYNMIHFTPVQELGESNSAYSLSGQLKLNPSFNDNNTKITFADIEKLAAKIRTEWKVVSICDIVLNHTANETDWLEEHPESTYNCLNCPYMRPAYLLDAALHQFSVDVKNGLFDTWGIPSVICTEDHLNATRHALHTKILPEINLPELYTCNVTKLVSEFLDRARKVPPNAENKNPDQKLKLIRDPLYQRLATRVDMDLALKIHNIYRQDSFDEETRLRRCGEEFKNNLDQLNKEIVDELSLHLNAAVENCLAGMRYFRVQHDGPHIKEITKSNPLCPRYFTDYGNPKSLKEHEILMYGANSKFLMAHNGWVMNADPMRNFADADSNVYIRRELIAWGDSVKLRFGDKPEDSPFLWNHMKAYVEQTAKVFDGVRLDNCHSTPIPVAEYLLDCARRVRPDLYVVAELFTNSDHTDNIFVNRLGISSLIREAMSAWDSHEEGRLVYRYGGDPVGAFFQPHFRPLVPSIAHALFLDLTHDNPSPVEKRSVFDLLPSAALVNMGCCASGSNRGYDELVNHHIHVVDEGRQYTEWTNDESLASGNPRHVSYKSGIISAKKAINDLHFKLGIDGFNQVYVDQMDPDIVAVTRHQPEKHQSVILVAFTAFGHPHLNAATCQRAIKPLRVEGVLDEIILEATLSHKSIEKGGSKYTHPENFVKDNKWINGLSEYQVNLKQHIQVATSDVFELADSGNPNITQLNFKNFKPGSVVAIRVSQPKSVQQSIHKLRDLMLSFSRNETTDLKDIIGRLNLADLNRALYRCDQEEQDEGKGFGTYNIPNFGSLVYCGFQGFMSLLSTIRPSNDLGHPMCGNLRDGNWMIDYTWQRLKLDDGTKELGLWIEKNTQPLRDIPRYLIPGYFDIVITGIYILLIEQAYNLMSNFVKNGSTFVKGLSLGSLQFAAVIKSADLAPISPNLAPPKPPTKSNDQGKLVQACVTLSAGLPHFSTGYMRNWGRDTFIALRGLFILTGRYQDARYHILGYAACLRHGLIPNLLDGGRNSRFNCRDAVWWWLYCIKSYVEEAPNGIEILSDKVSRIFPTDDSPPLEPGVEDQALYEVMQEALKVHFQGLAFRERNAGRQIDAHMSDRGFNNQIGIHPETGFVFGGNEANCGTWMDKMGSSDKANNRGKPATPRDGSAVELVGLSKSVVTWLHELYQQKKYPYCGVERTSKSGTMLKWSFKQWSGKIQNSFEQFFWINKESTDGEIRPDLINKRGIYKDSYGATQAWADFQLRCNFPIAMVAAPELFDPKHAWIALQNAEKHLLGPLGMKTLDPDDWAYCGDYNNADDSDISKTAHGFNYHQGPEWVWPIGYFLRAKLHFAAANNELPRTLATTKTILSKHFTELQTSAWRGLPELTNSNGSYCHDSSRTQAWSMACVLEVLHDLQRIESKQHASVLN